MTIDFADVLERGKSAIEQAVIDGQSESLTLDYKADRQGKPAMFKSGALTKEGRSVLARAMSAFANSAGGVVVFGVDCRKVKGIDKANELAPIEHLSSAFASVNGEAGELLQPRHDGIRVHPVATDAKSNRGYLVVDVPRSERRPHMSQVDHRYYKRAGASTFQMEHYDVEDAFQRKTSPILNLMWEFEEGIGTGSTQEVRAVLFVANSGVRTAKSITLKFSENQRHRLRPGHSSPGIWPSEKSAVLFVPPSDLAVHPDTRRRVGDLLVKLSMETNESVTIDGIQWDEAKLEFEYELSAEDTSPKRGKMVWSPEDLHPFVIDLDNRR